MYKHKSFKRIEGVRSDILFVVATEGKDTERIYFEALRKKLQMSRIRLEILSSDNNESAPNKVFERLQKFQDLYDVNQKDQLWVIIDKDHWKDKMLSEIAQYCFSQKNYYMGLSNPCFELWLLLHCEDVMAYDQDELAALKANKKINKNSDTWIKRKIRSILGSYTESSYDVERLLANLPVAISRAVKLDVNKKERWPQGIGTRVYRLVKNILKDSKCNL